MLHLIIDLLLFRLRKHDVTHLLLLCDFLGELRLLFSLEIEFFTSLLNDLLIKLFPLLLILLTKFNSEFDLLVEDVFYLLFRLLMLQLLVFDLLLM